MPLTLSERHYAMRHLFCVFLLVKEPVLCCNLAFGSVNKIGIARIDFTTGCQASRVAKVFFLWSQCGDNLTQIYHTLHECNIYPDAGKPVLYLWT